MVWSRKTREQMREIDRAVAETAVQHNMEALKETYAAQEEVLLYLNELHQDVIIKLMILPHPQIVIV